MKIKEVIKKLEKIEQEQGNKEFGVYLSYSKITKIPNEIYYDEKENNVYVGVYA